MTGDVMVFIFHKTELRHTFASRGAGRPGVCNNLRPGKRRAQGKPGARCSHGSRATKSTGVGPQVHRNARLSLRSGLRLTSCSPRRSGLFVTVIGGITSANLTPASRRQDHTTSPSAFRAVRQERIGVHRIPARVRDDRDTPLCRVGTGRTMPLIWAGRKPESFFRRDWTTQITLMSLRK
jgi:hypothetical protein